MWNIWPDPLYFYIFSHLEVKDLLRAGRTCKKWNQISKDDFLWKRLLYQDFKIDPSIPRLPGKNSWYSEYKRLCYHTPKYETEVLRAHSNQVLHVSFSHNGKMFATSSKDGFIKVWLASYPARVLYSTDMKSYGWNYTQFSQFNESDTLLLVSGVHFGNHTTSGEIAVFSLERFSLKCRVLNKPYDIFGTWYTDDFLLSGRLHFLGHLISCSFLWLNKASQEVESERKPIIKRLFKFYNKNASSIRTIMVANCLTLEDSGVEPTPKHGSPDTAEEPIVPRSGNPVSYNALSSIHWEKVLCYDAHNLSQDIKVDYGAESRQACTMNSPIRYSKEYRQVEDSTEHFGAGESSHSEEEPAASPPAPEDDDEGSASDFEDPYLPWNEEWQNLSDESMDEDEAHFSDEEGEDVPPEEEEEADEKILDPREKYLIFTMGSLTYTPHQIGIKRIKPFMFAERVKETPSLPQRIAEYKEREEKREREPRASPNWHDERSVAHLFDKVDHIFDFHGHIIGMGLSPDHRYLYVNNRPWPKNYHIDNALMPPPIAQEIDIHVIDLVTLKEVGGMLRSHKAYTPNDECFFIFLDVSDQYVASGAEDKHGYLWDRHYGTCLAKLPHSDVVNSVAFNPTDPEMLVTASDDHTLKIWRSRHRIKELGIALPSTSHQ